MIHAIGHLKPTPEQVRHLRKWADDSFCSSSDEAFVQAGFPSFEGWVRPDDTALLLRLKNVEPHSDPWVARGPEPRARRALFWLMEGGGINRQQGVFFGCGRSVKRLRPGDFVVFNDTSTHWVMSDRFWRGAAVQLRRAQ